MRKIGKQLEILISKSYHNIRNIKEGSFTNESFKKDHSCIALQCGNIRTAGSYERASRDICRNQCGQSIYQSENGLYLYTCVQCHDVEESGDTFGRSELDGYYRR